MIELSALKYKYKNNLSYALNGVNLSINSGEKILIAGKNGAGKTTLSKILAGIIPLLEGHGAMEGEALYNSRPYSGYKYGELRGKISLLFQDFEGQIVSTTVKEELVFYPMNLGRTYGESLGAAKGLAADFGISGLLDRNIAELSGGEKQKTAILSLMTARPEILILDEPLTDLDPYSQEAALEMIKNFKGTLIVFEQSVDCYEYFDRILIMKDGALISGGGKETAGEVLSLDESGIGAPEIFRAAGGYFPSLKSACGAIEKNYIFDAEKYSRMSAEKISPAAIIQVKNLSFAYPGAPENALSGVSFDIKKGEFLAVVGANGSGKTTLMKIIAVIYPDFSGGEIYYNGVSIRRQMAPGRAGYVYQNPDNQIFSETVFDEIAFALRVKGAAESGVREKVNAIMKTFGLTDCSGADPFSLPKGDRQKVACASVLVTEPQVIILDEPTTGLDRNSYDALMEIIRDLNSRGRTIVAITHSMEAAAGFGDRILALSGGRVVYEGDKRKFLRDGALVKTANVKPTGLMEASMELNGNILLNYGEFAQCWRKK